jgi:hypothetical protein
MSKFKIKIMLICFLNIRSIFQFEFVSDRTTDNQKFFVEVSKRFTDAVRCKRELWRDRSFILHHDNAPAHSLLRVLQFLAGKGIPAMDHPAFSPDLTPADF